MNRNQTNAQAGETAREQLELKLGEQLHALIGASHVLNVRAAQRFDPAMQPAAFHIVRRLYSYGPASAATLAEATAMDRSSVSRLIKSLEQAGYVRKEASPEDGRSVLLSLTASGRERTEQALKEKETVFYERISHWEEGQLAAFIGMLRDFNGFPR